MQVARNFGRVCMPPRNGTRKEKDIYIVRSGKQTRFWKDVWLEECPLLVCFPKIYKICHDQDISVQFSGEADWNLSCRRCFGAAEMVEWIGGRRWENWNLYSYQMRMMESAGNLNSQANFLR